MELMDLGLQKKKIEQFNKKGIESVEDLINFYPRAYNDISPKRVMTVKEGDFAAAILSVKKINYYPNRTLVRCLDDEGRWVNITSFNSYQKFEYATYHVAGKLTFFNGFPQFVSPSYCEIHEEGKPMVMPVYSVIKGMATAYLRSSIEKALDVVKVGDYLDKEIKDKYNLLSRHDSYIKAHMPQTMDDVKMAQNRKVFDLLFHFNFLLYEKALKDKSSSKIRIKSFKISSQVLKELPFSLTEGSYDGEYGQMNVLRSILLKAKEGKKINALVQGDVGAGKTVVAMLSILAFVESGYQAALMAPTQVLAEQHYKDFEKALSKFGIRIVYLSGTLKAKEKRAVLEKIKNGEADIVVGTHSIVSKDVEFKKLGIVVTDEEHKFGVSQRDALKSKALDDVHYITMSATPIPRSIAMTVYGKNMDIFTINMLPPGRTPVETKIVSDVEAAYSQMLQELNKGHQCYIVCPMIEDSESESMSHIESVDYTLKEAETFFGREGYEVSSINGKMKKEEIDDIINRFRDNEFHVLISTTIVEVGVNIPNATAIMIKNAERFGLAQLHQLRGRVGRGKAASKCFLHVGVEDTEKLSIMEKTTNGFKIALEDLKYRGVGDLFGTEQSGENKAIQLMLKYRKLDSVIKDIVADIFQDDEKLERYKKTIEEDPFF